jgi:hypothetical protein
MQASRPAEVTRIASFDGKAGEIRCVPVIPRRMLLRNHLQIAGICVMSGPFAASILVMAVSKISERHLNEGL